MRQPLLAEAAMIADPLRNRTCNREGMRFRDRVEAGMQLASC